MYVFTWKYASVKWNNIFGSYWHRIVTEVEVRKKGRLLKNAILQELENKSSGYQWMHFKWKDLFIYCRDFCQVK